MENFNVPSCLLINPAVLGLYATGRTTGFAIDCGESQTRLTPIFDGYPVKGTVHLDIGGKDVTNNLGKLLREKHFYFVGTKEFELVRGIKEKYCHVVPNYDQAIKNAGSKPVNL